MTVFYVQDVFADVKMKVAPVSGKEMISANLTFLKYVCC